MSVRLGGTLKELRFHLCQTSPHSQGIRDFIQKHYVSLKKTNPNFPILIRECKDANACVWARYEKGVERTANLANVSASDILKTVQQLAK